ncbi:acyl-CoA dehydrogenase family protein [Amycolatopsis sp.]|uniref:acyl-CoA dehydrogenase family protein n=1 Tax=Amycolatopsis sp. TaxID=37632 RepID=UPI002B952C7E|nr:acyl-CoA dehydrogenase family protein [Amycolatopsis sp.]HVV08425.1 acyl-CoA dehydrogenase family protein [Amycolatopsis sp.]
MTAPAPFLTDDRLAIQAMAREFAMKEVLPVANELDPGHGEIPMELREKMAGLGFFGILIPEEYGGLGLGLSEYAIIVEELARGWMSVASLIARGQQFTAGFDAEQRKRYLPAMARGEFLSAFALSEAEAGSDVANLRCRATPDGDGWRITGQKMWCTFADGSDYLQVFARTEPVDPAHRSRGVTCFLMPKERGTLPEGVTGTPVRKIGYHGWKTWELAFEDAYAEEVVGEPGQGFRIAMGDLDTARIHTAARAIGLARGALEDAVAYAGERVQFGRPIGANQGLRFKIAGMAAQVEAARALMYQVCTNVDAGQRSPVQASMVKLVASEMAERVTSEGLQIHGGAGYTTDFPAERYWRDARLTKIFEGTSEIQLRIISDALLGRDDRR